MLYCQENSAPKSMFCNNSGLCDGSRDIKPLTATVEDRKQLTGLDGTHWRVILKGDYPAMASPVVAPGPYRVNADSIVANQHFE